MDTGHSGPTRPETPGLVGLLQGLRPRALRSWRALAGGWLAWMLALPALAQLPPVSALLQGQTGGATVQTEQVRAELLVHAPKGLQPGQRIDAGLLLEHAPDWHTYWQNPGDSGLPTTLRWTLPEGLQAGEIQWPLPRKFPIGTLANYGYEGRILLPVSLQIDAQARLPSTVRLRLDAQWLACRQECIPQEGSLQLELPTAAPLTRHAEQFEAARAQIPQLLSALKVNGQSQQGGTTTLLEDGRLLQVEVKGLPLAWRGEKLSLFPITANVVHNAARQDQDWTQSWNGAVWTARILVSAERADSPPRMQWVLARGDEQAPQVPALQVDTPVQGQWPALDAPAQVPDALAKALAENAAAPAQAGATSTHPLGLGLALLGALVGGLILNLMPCVFPVLAIKVLGLTRAGQDASQHRAAGLAYTAGAVASFIALGGLMLALRAAGEQLGWGFQLQSPGVVAALAVLFTLLGLNLAGLFEIGQILPSRLASLQSRHPTVDAALSGVLAVAIASPCTAPFMGASLGLAVSLPAWQALPVFGAMGLGMALPYLLVSFWPALAHRLPRPGAWMQTFRQFTAFPMLATVVWLLWVLGLQTGMDTVALLLAGLLSLALLLWALQQSGRARWAISALALALLAALAWQGRNLPGAVPPAGHTPQALADPSQPASTRWQPWSPALVEARLAAGQTVFVDFTAAWCVTCQYNKKTVLADAQVLAALDRQGVITLRADWTRRDETITRALNALGRSGVPVYALYRPGQAPLVLSELPSVGEVLEALGVER